VNANVELCFDAFAQNREVIGLADWSYATDDGTITANPLAPLCPVFTPAKAGTAHVHASAGGATLDASVTVVASGHARSPRAYVQRRTPAGERASM
jgi:hypothetical protein